MNPQNASPDRATLRAECETAMMEAFALGKDINDSQEDRLAELFTLFPDLREEYRELCELARAAQRFDAPIPPDWERAEQRFVAALSLRAEAIQTRTIQEEITQEEIIPKNAREQAQSLVTNIAKSVKKARVGAIFSLSAKSVVARRFALAASFAVIFVCGAWFGRSASGGDEAEFFASATKSQTHALRETSAAASLEPFLHDAHLLLIGVMSMNAECGVANPQALDAQRRRGLELLKQARSLRLALSAAAPGERQALSGLNQVEYALVEIVGAQPSALTTRDLRRLQAETDYALCEVSTLLALRNK
jgi:hypothetical protein